MSPWWHLFDSSPFVPRQQCGDWSPWLVYSWVVPSLVIAMLYLAVAQWQVRRYFETRSTDYPRWSALAVACLFTGCAFGHLCNVAAFHWPAYRFFIVMDWFTLAASVAGWFGLHAQHAWNETKYLKLSKAEMERARFEATVDSESAEKQKLRIALTLAESELEVLKQKLATADVELLRLRPLLETV